MLIHSLRRFHNFVQCKVIFILYSISHGVPKGPYGTFVTPKELLGACSGTQNCHRNDFSPLNPELTEPQSSILKIAKYGTGVSVSSSFSTVKKYKFFENNIPPHLTLIVVKQLLTVKDCLANRSCIVGSQGNTYQSQNRTVNMIDNECTSVLTYRVLRMRVSLEYIEDDL